MYDYMLGGKDNFAADRMAVQFLEEDVPHMPALARANRRFHQRAARFIARQGISQFIDVGCGLPTSENTHDAVPGANVAYADCDGQVVLHARAILARQRGGIAAVRGDLRDPVSIFGAAELHEVIDLTRPCGLLMTAVLHFVGDGDDPAGLVAFCMSCLAPGSWLALSHGRESRPGIVTGAYARASQQAYSRTQGQILGFFDGLELVPPWEGAVPGIAPVTRWAGDGQAALAPGGDPGPHDTLWCGVARKPGAAPLTAG